MFQDPASQLVMERVADDVAFGLENRAWPRPAMHRRVPEVLAQIGLERQANRRTAVLSGGQQQRLALAGALAPRPPVLVLDEPTANLDPPAAEAFVARLAALRDSGTTIVLVEHRVELVWPLADLVLALDRDGRPIELGPPAEVIRRSGGHLAQAGIWLPAAIEHRLGVPGPSPFSPTAPGGPVAPFVTADSVGFAYVRGRPVLDDVSLDVRAGERLALVGPNGSGKSTLGRLLVGLLRPDTGTVRLGGADPWRLRPADLARRAGYVFQDPEAQFLGADVASEVQLGLRSDELERVPKLMAGLGLPLETFGGRSPYALSGGEQRRLSIACVLVRRPTLLVLDEPTFGQDRGSYEGLLDILRMRVEEGTAIVAATHDPRFVTDVATRTIRIEPGHVHATRSMA